VNDKWIKKPKDLKIKGLVFLMKMPRKKRVRSGQKKDYEKDKSRVMRRIVRKLIDEEEVERENIERYGVARCPECGSLDIERKNGEVYCKHCGFVIDEGFE